MAQEQFFQGTGWGAVCHDLASSQPKSNSYQFDGDDDGSGPNSPVAGSAPPPDLVAAFLQSHKSNAAASLEQHQTTDQPHGISSSSSKGAPVLRSSSINSDADGDCLPLLNPFAANGKYPPLPHPTTTPAQQQHLQAKVAAAPIQQQQQQPRRKARSFLQRLFRGLMITSASAGLVALGAWGGSLAYRHYMAQLDDRDQLARRVADLQKQEEKLVLRCTALEQDRQNLASQLADASSALSSGSATRSKLRQQLTQVQTDREETVQLNLNLQRKLSAFEEQHKEKQQALNHTLADAARLDKEMNKLLGTVGKLESRCAALEAANSELKRENSALSSAQHKLKTQEL